MKLLHNKSIRECTELDEDIHQAEVEMISLITIECFGEGKSPIDRSKVFTPLTQELQKDLSV